MTFADFEPRGMVAIFCYFSKHASSIELRRPVGRSFWAGSPCFLAEHLWGLLHPSIFHLL
jgi:hypothetical protein